MNTHLYKAFEFFLLFILIPVSFVFDYSPIAKAIIGLLGFIYVIWVLLVIEKEKFRINNDLKWSVFWKETLLKLVVIIGITICFVYFSNKDLLFVVIRNKPGLWVFILFIYSFFSVYPQELLYRTFFFKRYESLFKSKQVFLFVNAFIFMLGHLFFQNLLVLVLTFLGGLLFAFTYQKSKSTLQVSIEHAIYGCWLFTVGMGSMLGFPS